MVVGIGYLALFKLFGSLFLNGVNIDGVTNQKFEKSTVRVDDKGNVFIEAPGYAAKTVEGGPPPSTETPGPVTASSSNTPKLTRHYFLLTEQTAPGMTQFDIDVYLNSKWLRRLKNDQEQVVADVTSHLIPGKNTVLLVAQKLVGEGRKSFSPSHIYKITLGEGIASGDHILIENPVMTYKRTAAEAEGGAWEYTFNTR